MRYIIDKNRKVIFIVNPNVDYNILISYIHILLKKHTKIYVIKYRLPLDHYNYIIIFIIRNPYPKL